MIDAYLSPLLGRYLARLGEAAGERGPARARGDAVLGRRRPGRRGGAARAPGACSPGPAGGAVGAGLLARLSGDGDALGFDMGGTSCDVCVVEDGRVRRTDSREIDGRVIQLPMVDVHTVGAGGGSIGWRDRGGALRVGPRSAGAEPGPAPVTGAAASEPTVTDANLLLGYLAPDSTLAGGVELDAERRRARRVAQLGDELGLDPLETAEGIVRVANQEMVRALRVVTVERGVDPRGFALLPFGGAGPMHAAAIADELGIERILCPRASGVLSALGLLASERRRDTARTVMLRGDELTAERIAAEVAELRDAARARGSMPSAIEVGYELRYRGPGLRAAGAEAGATPEPGELAEAFARRARAPLRLPRPRRRGRAGRRSASRWSSPGPEPRPRGGGRRAGARDAAGALRRRVDRGRGRCAASPPPAATAAGPCVFELPEATLVLPPGWSGSGRRGRARSSRSDERPMSRASTRSRCRSWSARCAPPATRWARC